MRDWNKYKVANIPRAKFHFRQKCWVHDLDKSGVKKKKPKSIVIVLGYRIYEIPDSYDPATRMGDYSWEYWCEGDTADAEPHSWIKECNLSAFRDVPY